MVLGFRVCSYFFLRLELGVVYLGGVGDSRVDFFLFVTSRVEIEEEERNFKVRVFIRLVFST